MKIPIALIALVAATVLTFPTEVAAQKKGQDRTAKTSGQTVAVNQLPAPVTQSVQSMFPNGSIVSASKLTLGQDVRYELSLKPTSNASPVLIMSTPEGSLRTIAGKTISSPDDLVAAVHGGKKGAAKNARESIKVSELPDAVTKAIQKQYPKATIGKAFKTMIGKDLVYEVILKEDKKEKATRVVVDANGTIRKNKK